LLWRYHFEQAKRVFFLRLGPSEITVILRTGYVHMNSREGSQKVVIQNCN